MASAFLTQVISGQISPVRHVTYPLIIHCPGGSLGKRVVTQVMLTRMPEATTNLSWL